MNVEHLFRILYGVFEVVGVLAITVGFAVAAVFSFNTWRRTHSGTQAFKMMRESFGGVILLGLEILVAADLVKTVAGSPTLYDILILATVVLIRTILSFSLQVEIEGVAPCKRALVTGPSVLTQAGRRSFADPARGLVD